MLTLKKLKEMKPHTIFAKGKKYDDASGINMTRSGKLLKWVAVRGDIHDWAIYCDWANKSWEDVKDLGNKVTLERNIRKLVECDDGSFKMYRY